MRSWHHLVAHESITIYAHDKIVTIHFNSPLHININSAKTNTRYEFRIGLETGVQQ